MRFFTGSKAGVAICLGLTLGGALIAGEDIPLAARIISACDTYEAIVTDRPYRDCLGEKPENEPC